MNGTAAKSNPMTESKRRSNIKKIQARQRRYHALGRCRCGRELRLGYKRCDNCIKRIDKMRANYQKAGRCYCGNPVFPRTKPNGTPYRTCHQCRERELLRYHGRESVYL